MKKSTLILISFIVLVTSFSISFLLFRDNPIEIDDTSILEEESQPMTPEIEIEKAEITQNLSEPFTLQWTETKFLQEVGIDVRIVTDLLVSKDGRVFATFVDQDAHTYVSFTEDGGDTWETNAMPVEVKYIRALRQLSDSSFIIGVGVTVSSPILYRSENGMDWEPIANDQSADVYLPNETSGTVWDIAELSDGTVIIATDELSNDPLAMNTTVYALKDDVLKALAPLPGLGVLALEVTPQDVIYVTTEESTEHDDADLAGQARVFKLRDMNQPWEEVAAPQGANRVYDVFFENEVLYLATGLYGNFYRSSDEGKTWGLTTHVPVSSKLFGNPPEMIETDASRIYSILQLQDGRLLVGVGNEVGDLFTTDDQGDTWELVDDPGPNNVVWGLAQEEDGTVWVGTGSVKGTILKAEMD
jgi:photosystem II stability/assembly factor-like uncharacterized protein